MSNTDKILNIKFTWDNRNSILVLLSHQDNVRFAVFCAEQVIYLFESKYPEDNRPREAIEAAKMWLINPSAENKSAADAAAHAAYTAADAAYAAAAYAADAAYAAANAAYAAANAAYAAYAAYTAADAAYAAAAYAADAAYAATTELNSETIKEEQMNCLRSLILSSLSEEDRDNWLLVASL